MEPEEREFWVLLTVFGALFALGPFLQSIWWASACTLTGLGGLAMLMRDRLRLIRDRVSDSAKQIPVRTPLKLIAVIAVSVLAARTTSTIIGLRSDADRYLIPRRVSEKQAKRLREYLSQHDPSAVTITVVPNDQEAMEFAAELFTALRKTKWGIKPPDHGGVGYIQIPSNAIKPKRNDDARGITRYKSNDEYLDARDAWLQKEIARQVQEQTSYSIGVAMFAQSTEQAAVLHAAFDYAEIQLDSVGSASSVKGISLIVGHRPTIMRDDTPILYKIGDWIQRLAQ